MFKLLIYVFILLFFSSLSLALLLDALRQLIKRQTKQKESLECELEKEREKLQMIRLDIVTLTSPAMTQFDLRELCDEITRLRSVCERLSDDIDLATAR